MGVILSERVTCGISVLSLGNLDGTAPQPSTDRSTELSLLSQLSPRTGLERATTPYCSDLKVSGASADVRLQWNSFWDS